jgi:hypothetical protein
MEAVGIQEDNHDSWMNSGAQGESNWVEDINFNNSKGRNYLFEKFIC